jgi:hypothetical protein
VRDAIQAIPRHDAALLVHPRNGYEARLELTPLRVERDRADFEGWFLLDRVPGLLVRRGSCPGRWAAAIKAIVHCVVV